MLKAGCSPKGPSHKEVPLPALGVRETRPAPQPGPLHDSGGESKGWLCENRIVAVSLLAHTNYGFIIYTQVRMTKYHSLSGFML